MLSIKQYCHFLKNIKSNKKISHLRKISISNLKQISIWWLNFWILEIKNSKNQVNLRFKITKKHLLLSKKHSEKISNVAWVNTKETDERSEAKSWEKNILRTTLKFYQRVKNTWTSGKAILRNIWSIWTKCSKGKWLRFLCFIAKLMASWKSLSLRKWRYHCKTRLALSKKWLILQKKKEKNVWSFWEAGRRLWETFSKLQCSFWMKLWMIILRSIRLMLSGM